MLRTWLSCLLALAATPAAAQETFDYGRHLGLAFPLAHDSLCLSIRAPGLAPGTRLVLVDSQDSAVAIPAAIRAPRTASCPHDLPESGDAFYLVTTDAHGGPASGSVMVAVIGSGFPLAAGADGVTGDLDGDGVPEFFRECTSNEGVHFTVWSRAPLVGPRRWHRYYYLGYDVEPSCTEAEYRQ